MSATDVVRLRSACGWFLVALLVLLVDVWVGGIDLVNDVVGAVLLVVGARLLAPLAGSAPAVPVVLAALLVPAVAAEQLFRVGPPTALVVQLVRLLFWVAVARVMAELDWPGDPSGDRLRRRWSTQLLLVAVVEGTTLVVGVLVWATRSDAGTQLLLAVPLVVAGLVTWAHRVVALATTRSWAGAG